MPSADSLESTLGVASESSQGRSRLGAAAAADLGRWWEASDSDKRDRFHLHLRWASERGAIEPVANLLSSMKPEDWHTER